MEAAESASLFSPREACQPPYGGFNRIGDLTRFLFDDAWQEALNAGLVSEKMLIPQAEPTKEKVMA